MKNKIEQQDAIDTFLLGEEIFEMLKKALGEIVNVWKK